MCFTQSWAGIFEVKHIPHCTYITHVQNLRALWKKRHQQNLIQITLNIRFFLLINYLHCQFVTKNILLLLLVLALQPAVGFGLSNNTSPFVRIYHQLCPSSHSQHLRISIHFSPWWREVDREYDADIGQASSSAQILSKVATQSR